MHDLRFAFRLLRRSPGTTALAIGVLALGIGANLAVFSVLRAALLRPLPIPQAERLVSISGLDPFAPGPPAPTQQLAAWLTSLRNTGPVVMVEMGPVSLGAGATPISVRAAEVTGSYFTMLEVAPVGRPLTAADEAAGHGDVAVIADDLAHTLGGARAALGRKLVINGRRVTVVGVMPTGVVFPEPLQVWLPTPLPWSFASEWLAPDLAEMGFYARLRPGATLAQTRQEVHALHQAQATGNPLDQGTSSVEIWRTDRLGDSGTALWLLFAAAGLLLVLACADLAHMQMARAVARRGEFALRAALGAGLRHLIRQTLVESLALAAGGVIAGVALAALGVPLLRAVLPRSLTALGAVRLDGMGLALAAVLGLASAALFGLFPLLESRGHDLRASINRTPGRGWRARLRSGLVAFEVALAFVLVTGAGMAIEGLMHLNRVPLGFQTEHIVTAHLQLSGPAYRMPDARQRFHDTLLPQLKALPGVTAAALSSQLPLSGSISYTVLSSREPTPTSIAQRFAMQVVISPDYFRVLDVPLVAGRTFNGTDLEKGPLVALVDRGAAERLWPGQDPIGKHIADGSTSGPSPDWLEVVGVVGSVNPVIKPLPYLAFYRPLAQMPQSGTYIVVRTAAPLGTIGPELRHAVAALDANVALSDLATETGRQGKMLAPLRFKALLLDLFGGLALLLGAAGTFAALAFWAEQRRTEIGVRMAIGASPSGIVRLVLRQAAPLIAVGLLLGLAGALATGKLLASILYGVAWYAPGALATAAAIMTAVALLAAYLPARRASRLEPLTALRAE